MSDKLGMHLRNGVVYSGTFDSAVNKKSMLTSTLAAGETSLTISNGTVTSDDVIDVYVDDSHYGACPTSVSVETGKIVLTFAAQSTDMTVGVKILFSDETETQELQAINQLNSNVSSLNSNLTDLTTTVNTDRTYSTSEKEVGTWIDGSTVYEKTYYGTASVTTSSTTVDIASDLEGTTIDLTGSIHDGQDRAFGLDSYSGTSEYHHIYTTSNDTMLRLWAIASTSTKGTWTYYVTRRYIKA